LLLVSILACAMPAWRAARVRPSVALRFEWVQLSTHSHDPATRAPSHRGRSDPGTADGL